MAQIIGWSCWGLLAILVCVMGAGIGYLIGMFTVLCRQVNKIHAMLEKTELGKDDHLVP